MDKLYELVAAAGGFYEPLGSYEELLNMVTVNDVLARGNAPAWTWNGLNISLRLFESVYGAPLGVLPLPPSGEPEQGIHQVTLFGGRTRSGGLRFVNSWGVAWGDGGRGVLSRAYIERYMVEAWLDRPAGAGPTRFAAPLLERASDPATFVAAWMPTLPGLRQVGFAAIDRRVRHNGAEHLVRVRETLSASDADDPVEMIELHGPSGVPLGWAHLHHLTGKRPRLSVCKEFFVWPLARRWGHGRLLEEQVSEQADDGDRRGSRPRSTRQTTTRAGRAPPRRSRSARVTSGRGFTGKGRTCRPWRARRCRGGRSPGSTPL